MVLRLLLVFLLSVRIVSAQSFFPAEPDKHCASQEERKLYNLVNEYRKDKQMEALPLSRALSYVARVHALDLSVNRPDFGGCNMHSWSDKGNWKPCCYADDENRVQCMTLKPKEITGYKYKAYEAVYSGSEAATADEAFALWSEISVINDLLLNSGKWTKPWQVMGVGIYDNYACIWFGEGLDNSDPIMFCEDTAYIAQQKLQATAVNGKITEEDSAINATALDGLSVKADSEVPYYYIITSSTGTLKQATDEVQRLVKAGYMNASYLDASAFFRIAIDRFTDESKAYKQLEIIKLKFPDAWLLKPKLLK